LIFAASLNVHANPSLTRRNIDLIKRNVTHNISVLIEGSTYDNWPLDFFKDIQVIEGFKHTAPRNPYKNVFLNLKTTYEKFPNCDWYVFSEFDNFIINENFKNDFQYINENYSLIANDFRQIYCEDNLFESSLGIKFENFYCMLGCCYFIKKNFMEILYREIFEKFLSFSSFMPQGFYPNFHQYDVTEVLLPTLCKYYNFDVFSYARFKEEDFSWQGMYKKYMMRFRPNIEFFEVSKQASIIHPIKSENSLNQILYDLGKK
jgi:hypothetical protein